MGESMGTFLFVMIAAGVVVGSSVYIYIINKEQGRK